MERSLLEEAVILPSSRNFFRAPWYNPHKGGGAITIGKRIYFTRNWFTDTGFGTEKSGNSSYSGHSLHSKRMWLSLLSHEIGHLTQAKAFGTDRRGIMSYLMYFSFGYLYRALTFKPSVHDGFNAEITADLGRYVFNRTLRHLQTEGTNETPSQKEFITAISHGQESKVNAMLKKMEDIIQKHTSEYKKQNPKAFSHMEIRLNKASERRKKRQGITK